MLIPQYSIRRLMGITAVCAVICLIFGLGARGSLWATGASLGLFALAVVMMVHAAFFGLVWLAAEGLGRLRNSNEAGPRTN